MTCMHSWGTWTKILSAQKIAHIVKVSDSYAFMVCLDKDVERDRARALVMEGSGLVSVHGVLGPGCVLNHLRSEGNFMVCIRSV